MSNRVLVVCCEGKTTAATVTRDRFWDPRVANQTYENPVWVTGLLLTYRKRTPIPGADTEDAIRWEHGTVLRPPRDGPARGPVHLRNVEQEGRFLTPEDMAGRRWPCPKCGATLSIDPARLRAALGEDRRTASIPATPVSPA